MQWTITAPAKINIGLDVYKLRNNEQKHRLKSIFVLVTKYEDKIVITESKKLEIKYLMQNDMPSIKNDIVLKTMNFLKNNFAIKTNYEIVIEKHIPIKAGLGGSSADSGAIIKFFIEKEKLVLDKSMLKRIALELGSDIPFFVSGYQVGLVSKYGNDIKLIDKPLPNFWIHENNVCSDTTKIYKAMDRNWVKQKKNNFRAIIKSFPDLSQCNIINHLEDIAIQQNLQLLHYKKSDLVMTGSGSYFISFKGK